MPACPFTAARALADKLVETLRAPIDLDGEVFHTTVSIDVAMSAEGEHNGEALLRRADAALYEAKRRGRNRVFCEGEHPAPGQSEPDPVFESSR
ncbi:diguanylate cyclase [Rhizobacter sp. J219]|uniref:diguanylate cyclase domain-containing protein n=1 Tax=Rhizobacter sp. J219 TaxID=2898430 RepID=UPI002151A603|nr:diguanylate cyclase [Rhizobacter sp. J219]MCR5882001.1 diguanylate cyclase [Rhizobacter sp. J219]